VCNEKGTAVRGLSPLLLLSYPFAVHLGVLSGQLLPALLILLLLLLHPLLLPPSAGRLALALGIATLLLLALRATPLTGSQLLYLPPPAIVLILWVMFARTLLPGQTPLITRIAALMHESLTPRLQRYTRWVTWAWVAFFSGLLVEIVLLSVYASAEKWSLFTNFINYLLLGAFFLTEYSLRRFFLRPEERLGFAIFCLSLLRIDFRSLLRQ
jgi:uncharacterized membrane protein